MGDDADSRHRRIGGKAVVMMTSREGGKKYMYGITTKKELLAKQLLICGQGDEVSDLLDEIETDTREGEIDEALIDDSLANFIRLFMYGSEDEVLDVLALTRNKLYQMEILFKFKEEKT